MPVGDGPGSEVFALVRHDQELFLRSEGGFDRICIFSLVKPVRSSVPLMKIVGVFFTPRLSPFVPSVDDTRSHVCGLAIGTKARDIEPERLGIGSKRKLTLVALLQTDWYW